MIDVPPDFAAGIVNLAGPDGRAWIDHLPLLVESLCERWKLAIDGAPMHGYLGLVVPVKHADEKCILKVSWLNDSTAHEIVALRLWNGRGAAQVFESDPAIGALLLERLDSKRSLRDVEIGEAIQIAGQLTARLAVLAPPELPALAVVSAEIARTLTERWDHLGRPVPARAIDRARDFAAQLGPHAARLVADYDLHYENVLAGTREPWLVIDPKVVAGDPEYGLAQLLWTRLDEMDAAKGMEYYFDALVDAAGLDHDLAQSWTIVRIVDYWLWALSVGLTEDPAKCAVIMSRLAA
jgi:streptomycin 6-kinase